MKNGAWRMGREYGAAVVLIAMVMMCAAGCTQPTPLPTEFIIWGDPRSDAESGLVSDLNNRLLRIALDGRIQDASGFFCEESCNVTTNGELFLEGELRGAIVWDDTTGPDDIPGTADDRRRPFFVTTDGFLMILDVSSGIFSFSPSDIEVDPDGTAGDNQAEFVGTVTDETEPQPPRRTLRACGAIDSAFLPIAALGVVALRVTRRRGLPAKAHRRGQAGLGC